MTEVALSLNIRQYLELEKLADGAFQPVSRFMDEHEFHSVVETMRLPDGRLFPLPIVLDIAADHEAAVSRADSLALMFHGQRVGVLQISSVYRCDKQRAAQHIFATTDTSHPGVAHFLRMGNLFVGGPVTLERRAALGLGDQLTPAETRKVFASNGWTTITGFQTRNIPHRAHEHLQRLALEVTDGLFIQPLVGWKRRGDCSPAAILAGYRALIDGFLPNRRILLGALTTAMRYAGPREALFHAIIRRNYGCTHFIVGRDHAGVGNFYGRYEAQELARRLEPELGISILPFAGPYNCARCGGIVTERSCPHRDSAPESITEISGSAVRAALRAGNGYPEWIRPEVLERLRGMQVLIEEDEE
jgi:sulfate adenylyltransferase